MQPKDWNKIRNILEEQLKGYIGQDEETVNAKLDALVTSLTGELTANVVKKVQRGVITIATGSTSGTSSITSVNTAKAFIVPLGAIPSTTNKYDSAMSAGYYDVQLTLSSATQVKASVGWSQSYVATSVAYQVIEFY